MAEPTVLEDAWINTNADQTKWIRVDPETGGLYRYNSGNGQYDIALPIAISAITGLQDALDGKASSSHTHTELGNINFTGTISSDSNAGLSGTKVIDGKTLTFTNGILTGYEV